MARCFVALWPADSTRARLDRLAQHLHALYPAARRMAPGNLHLTLAFLGDISDELAHRCADALAGLAAAGVWHVTQIGTFPRARVLWAGGAPDPALQGLADDVRRRLDALAVPYDRKRFVAHVSLLRHVDVDSLREPIEAIDWPLGTPVLVVSTRGADGAIVYRSWPGGR